MQEENTSNFSLLEDEAKQIFVALGLVIAHLAHGFVWGQLQVSFKLFKDGGMETVDRGNQKQIEISPPKGTNLFSVVKLKKPLWQRTLL